MLYQLISTLFAVVVVLSNLISAKMISLPLYEGFMIPAGLITYPLTFLISDLVTEIYGAKSAKVMVYMGFAMSLLSFGFLELALLLPSAQDDSAFQITWGLSGLRIFSSLTAYFCAQVIDIKIYTKIKEWTGARFLWARNNGSTWASQLVDTFIVDVIFLYWGLGMGFSQVLGIMGISFLYKVVFCVACTPLFYVLVHLCKRNVKKVQAV